MGRPLLLVFFDSVQMKTHQYSQAIHLFNYAERTRILAIPIYFRCDDIRILLGMSSVESSSTVMEERFFLRIISDLEQSEIMKQQMIPVRVTTNELFHMG